MKDGKILGVKDAVHKLQLSLLEGIKHESQLIAAGSLISQSDYQDVVTERTIAHVCGYPLCVNSLPSEPPRKGHYRISLKEHKVYDLHETHMYCSTECLIRSRAFGASLEEERSSSLDPAKINSVLKMFDGLSLDSVMGLDKSGDLGLSGLKIREKMVTGSGEMSLEEWVGPSNAIDGYVPRRDQNSERKQPSRKKTESNHAKPNLADTLPFDVNFTSTIIMQDEYSVSKTAVPREAKGKVKGKMIRKSVKAEKISVLDDTAGPSQNDTTLLKSSLKTLDSKKETRSVTWADEKSDGDGKSISECREIGDNKGAVVMPHLTDEDVGDESYRFTSAEACARALSQASEAVASGKTDASDAVSEAGVIILPPPHEVDEAKYEQIGEVVDVDPIELKWPPKPGFSSEDLFDSEDSWYDSPPEGFNLTLSPFSTMFMSLFAWISSSSLAYIYGKEERFHEDYLSINGREYPPKIIIDGRSAEVKHTLAGCLARALPGLVSEIRIPTPVSTIEQGMGRLLDTMSFTDALPGFRMKQWQVIALLFLDALSVSRIPALSPYMTGRRILLPKVLEGAQINVEEFEIMKDLIIPLGRVPQFSTQSGG
ncbi:hypothetical protein ABFS82_02G087600 [Erythranthe guttata]|uniref:RNA polymerase II subunit B1 CTD phosphatase RPAP2 homolog n=1 Tax=Erythranthe guttata TaxID=4155 RepID=A0A022PUD5_ERYGU|nr:PREDICTED: putative RNA polymerase II subunit B1 CTD phosphatase RPAP2 homolog [Erythranthe guttata]EYU19406.1 hypothetical protein MIMGU_mgv1a003240mg [Erythranthe guttata]|eukprot:XP_012859052.1 PREDICTED: putative RNA polymerase II subunit B1 CTD phosphatase RPAP2 homolog [Erythranthe guttata]